MRVLLTGVPGWLGGRFLEILVNGFNGEGPINKWDIRYLSMDGIATSCCDKLSGAKHIEKATGDVTKPETLRTALKDIDIVFHMAGIIHPKKVSEFYNINTQGTNNILKECVKSGVEKFVYISSNSVAGINSSHNKLMTENDPPRPYLNYGISKYLAEKIVSEFQSTGKIKTVILRPCWFYGPNQPLRQTKFFKMIAKGNPLMFGNGLNLRSMTYIDNLCQAMILSAENESANGQIYWIADKKPYSTYEIYKTVAELLEIKNFKPVHLPDFVSEGCFLADKILQACGIYISEIHVAGEMNKDIACDIKKASGELGYNPKIELREGMYRSIQWCRQNGLF